MKHQRLVIVSLIGVVLISSGIFYWFSEMESEKRLQDYVSALEKSNFYVEEYPFSESHVESVEKVNNFNDFQNFAIQEKTDHIFCDREINVLYLFHTIGNNKVEIIFFNY
ncbi:MAG: hypothetical protein P8X91_03685 [Candidatus Bathyarchaeota archaeon]